MSQSWGIMIFSVGDKLSGLNLRGIKRTSLAMKHFGVNALFNFSGSNPDDKMYSIYG